MTTTSNNTSTGRLPGPILIIGADGMLGSMFARAIPDAVRATYPDIDLTRPETVQEAFSRAKPRIVVNCAAYTDVDGAEQEEALATAVNGNGVGFLAQEAAKAGARLVHFSTDYVFAGEKETGYTENDAPAPLNAYGRSKLAGEQALQRTTKDLLLIRSAWLYGPSGKNFVDTMRQKMKAGEPLRVVNDQEGSPTFTEDLVEATLALLMRNAPSGIYHLVNSGRTTWFGLAEEIQKTLGTTSELIPVPSAEFPRPASRPRYSVLQNAKTDPLPAWEDALTRYLHATS